MTIKVRYAGSKALIATMTVTNYACRLSIWIADVDDVVVLEVVLFLADGSELNVGIVPAFCDIETTLMIDTLEETNSVSSIYTERNFETATQHFRKYLSIYNLCITKIYTQ